MKVILKFQPLLLALALAVAGCRHTVGVTDNGRADVAWAGFGQAGPAKITVFISGDVRHPGRYYLEDSATLNNIASVVGGWVTCPTCGGTPQRVRVMHHSGNVGKGEDYHIKQMTTEQLNAVRLRDGDSLFYATAHF